eukprot:scaffold34974_cov45-Attheya_sp.AAC.3
MLQSRSIPCLNHTIKSIGLAAFDIASPAEVVPNYHWGVHELLTNWNAAHQFAVPRTREPVPIPMSDGVPCQAPWTDLSPPRPKVSWHIPDRSIHRDDPCMLLRREN